MKRNKFKILKNVSIFLNIFLVLTFILNVVGAIVISPENEFIVENETYTVNKTMEFESIIISDSYIIFNNTGFYINSDNDITITLAYLDDDIFSSGNGDKVLEFYADTTGGTVSFSLSGFVAGTEYLVKRSGSLIETVTANSSGFISFENNIWSTHLFEIFKVGEGPFDVIPPVVSDVYKSVSIPLDTEIDFGWENISCTVTDNVEVYQVFLNITFPDSIKNNFLMINDSGIKYYFNTSFEDFGNYSYFIWASDTSGNIVLTGVYDFPLPPNCDINIDGEVNVLDQVLVSNHYSDTGSAGWIREDVDNNGIVAVIDLVIVSNNYGLDW